MKYSIIIPSYNRKDLLEACINAVIENTYLTENIELIIVCNGCKDGSVELVKHYSNTNKCIKIISWPEPLGFVKAVNLGLIVSSGEFVILLNNDCFLLNKNWIEILEYPFTIHPKAGITGPALQRFTDKLQGFIFFCVMIKRNVIHTIGYLDETFEIGHGEDADYTFKAINAGYEMYQVPYNTETNFAANHDMISGAFPAYHKSFQTRMNIANISEVIKKNSAILRERYNLAS
jgi:GT2 family glycosyltransferase